MFASPVVQVTRPRCPTCHRTYDDALEYCTGCGRELVNPRPEPLPWATITTGRSRYLLAVSLLGFLPLFVLAGTVAILGPSSNGVVLDESGFAVVACWYALAVGTFFGALAVAPGNDST